MVMGPPPS
ncbi:hypothetical protein HaLaN_29110 [Haematococcus lacustris]|uniref:Uncharacterized protein n=1 Tax=Haematococcus lacustris TaxID=44745 RepID=A0A6A0AC77_HAELA|nr:hypothetical protein HaLaN_29110 [Haematococcus lacustris]